MNYTLESIRIVDWLFPHTLPCKKSATFSRFKREYVLLFEEQQLLEPHPKEA